MDIVPFVTSQNDGCCWMILIRQCVLNGRSKLETFPSFIGSSVIGEQIVLKGHGENDQHLLKIEIRKV